MEQDQDFSSLRNLLALQRLDMPADTQVDQFLIEFHRRQRAQLLVPQSIWARGTAWVKERAAGLELAPSLSYASAFVAIALMACVGLSRQVQVTHVDGQSKLSFRMSAHDSSFALMPGSVISAPNSFPKLSASPAFVPTRADSAATRYVLANNAHGAYDATVAF
jgi:hypothetical protein